MRDDRGRFGALSPCGCLGCADKNGIGSRREFRRLVQVAKSVARVSLPQEAQEQDGEGEE